MNFFKSIITWIASLETGDSFRKWTQLFVKIFGILAFIGAIVWGIAICVGSMAAGSYLDATGRTLIVIGSILSLGINIILAFILIMLSWNRANKIDRLDETTHFALLPITVILIRLVGEVGFVLLLETGIDTLIASIFGSSVPGLGDILLGEVGIPGSLIFIVGLVSFVLTVLAGVVVLIIHYFIAEIINLFVDMATRLRNIETTLAAENKNSDA